MAEHRVDSPWDDRSGSDNLAHGVFGAAHTPTTGAATSCSSTLDNCVAPIEAFTASLASGSLSGAGDPVLYSGTGGDTSQSFWNIVDNNGAKHRD